MQVALCYTSLWILSVAKLRVEAGFASETFVASLLAEPDEFGDSSRFHGVVGYHVSLTHWRCAVRSRVESFRLLCYRLVLFCAKAL